MGEKRVSKRLADALGPQSDYSHDRSYKPGVTGRKAAARLRDVVTRRQRRADDRRWKKEEL